MALTFDEICIDAHDATALGEWWAQVLGWPHDIDQDGDVRLQPPPGQGPPWIFIAVSDDKVVKNRIHLDFKGEDQQAEVAVVGVPDDDLGQRIVAFVVGDAEPQVLIDFVAQQLSAHKRPREVRLVESLPRNAMGKVLKKELAGWA